MYIYEERVRSLERRPSPARPPARLHSKCPIVRGCQMYLTDCLAYPECGWTPAMCTVCTAGAATCTQPRRDFEAHKGAAKVASQRSGAGASRAGASGGRRAAGGGGTSQCRKEIKKIGYWE